MDDLFELTPKQQKAFNAAKKAMLALKKQGLTMYDNYGILGVVDSKKIKDYTDDCLENSIRDIGQNPNEFRSPFGVSWADDTHYFQVR
jgi:hypothetical protein